MGWRRLGRTVITYAITSLVLIVLFGAVFDLEESSWRQHFTSLSRANPSLLSDQVERPSANRLRRDPECVNGARPGDLSLCTEISDTGISMPRPKKSTGDSQGTRTNESDTVRLTKNEEAQPQPDDEGRRPVSGPDPKLGGLPSSLPKQLDPVASPVSRYTRPQLMVAVITGGNGENTSKNRQSVLDTWADDDTYFVTREEVSTKNVIRLPLIAEQGGRRSLGRKVLYMWDYIQEHFVDQYDWFMKADDDVYVNRERLLSDLSLLDPSKPFFLGSKKFGVSSVGLTGPAPLWQNINYLKFCHGGAGYIMSKGLLKLMPPGRFLQCLPEKPTLSIEDGRVAACIYRSIGVDCMSFRHKEYGCLDPFLNKHDQDKHKEALLKAGPEFVPRHATFHSVTWETMPTLHQQLTSDPTFTAAVVNKTHFEAQSFLQVHAGEYALRWSCNRTVQTQAAHQPATEQSVAMCMCPGSVVPPSDETPPKPIETPVWWQTTGAASTDTDANAIAMQCRSAEAEPVTTRPVLSRAALGSLAVRDRVRHNSCEAPTRLVVVLVPDTASVRCLPTFVASLLASTPCCIKIDVVHPAAANGDEIKTAVQQFDNVVVTRAPGLPSGWPYLSNRVKIFRSRLQAESNAGAEDVLLSHACTAFQRDPFRSVPRYGEVALFVREPLHVTGQRACSFVMPHTLPVVASLNSWLYLGSRKGLIKFFDFFSVIRSQLRLSSTCADDALLREAVFHKAVAARVSLSLFMPWDGPVADMSSNNVTAKWWQLWTGTEGKLAKKIDLVDHQSSERVLLVTNSNKAATSIIFNYTNHFSPGDIASLPVLQDSLWLARNFQTPPHQDLEPVRSPSVRRKANNRTVPSNHASGRHALPVQIKSSSQDSHNESKPSLNRELLTAQEYPREAKAAAALKKIYNAAVPASKSEDIFADLRQKLDVLYARYKSTSARTVVLKISSPKTHKTGSSTLSSILYRFGCRKKLRMYRPNDMSFLPGGHMNHVLKTQPLELKHSFDMEFHHITPNGHWHGKYDDAISFYKYIIGENVRSITVFREPKQQYVSWCYFYYVPQHMKEMEPLQALQHFVSLKKNANPTAGDFGLYEQQHVTDFIERLLPTFDLVLLSERFDEGLVLLRRIFNWSMLDITYVRLLDSATKEGSRRWDGKPLVPTPKLKNLDPGLVSAIDDLTKLDQQLYQAAVERFDTLVVQQHGFQEELEAFKEIQAQLSAACSSAPDHQTCLWYRLTDVQFFRTIDTDTALAPAVDIYDAFDVSQYWDAPA